jgi:perosamine synthetase
VKKLLITGVSGLLGSNLAHHFRHKYEILGLYGAHPFRMAGIRADACDITDAGDVRKAVEAFGPDVVIHCASLTNIDQCEAERERTMAVNVLATKILAAAVRDSAVKIVYVSTDAVHDGAKGDYTEEDPIRPMNYYGRTKYEGELEVAGRENFLIFRTNIFGWNAQPKTSLAEWILGELSVGRPIDCFTDARFSSMYTMELARALDIALQGDLRGVFNCASATSCSKYEFAGKIAVRFGLDASLIRPISVDQFHFKAKRGKNLSLNVAKLQRAIAYELPGIDQSVEAFYRDHRCRLPEEIRQARPEIAGRSVFLPYGRHWIDENDIQSVVHVLRWGDITQGPKVGEFEAALTEQCGARHAAATNSATSALHVACLAAGVGKGDEVITSPITFVASSNCVLFCGGTPVFADIDERTYNIAPSEIERKITDRTKAIIPVHFAGQSCDMDAIRGIADAAERRFGRKIYVIEDASHALGSRYKDADVGSCGRSDMAVMSFHPVKHITTGEGGAVFSNDPSLDRSIRLVRSHGITNHPEEFRNVEMAFRGDEPGQANPWYYEQIGLGYNYRITDIQCALGLSQLKKLEAFRTRRREIVDAYNEAFRWLPHVRTPFESEDCDSNFHLYVLLFDFEKIGRTRAEVMTELRRRNIQTQVHYIPVHLQPFYRTRFGTGWGDCPKAERFYAQCLSIPLHPSMTNYQVERVVSEISRLTKGIS